MPTSLQFSIGGYKILDLVLEYYATEENVPSDVTEEVVPSDITKEDVPSDITEKKDTSITKTIQV